MARKATRNWNKLALLTSFILVGCAAVPEIKAKPENLSFIVVNLVLDKVERLAEPGSKGFPPIKKEILSIGRFKLYSSFKLSMDKDRQDADNTRESRRYSPASDFPEMNSGLRLNRNMMYFEIKFKW